MKHPFYHKDDNNFAQAALVGYLEFTVGKPGIRSLRLVTDNARYGGDVNSVQPFGAAARSVPFAPASAAETSQRRTRDHLTAQSFAQLHKTLRLQPGEYRWDEVPWLASVWHARKKAAAENKPIFVFGTAGAGFNDPLGNC